jgi:hypothetical protein
MIYEFLVDKELICEMILHNRCTIGAKVYPDAKINIKRDVKLQQMNEREKTSTEALIA